MGEQLGKVQVILQYTPYLLKNDNTYSVLLAEATVLVGVHLLHVGGKCRHGDGLATNVTCGILVSEGGREMFNPYTQFNGSFQRHQSPVGCVPSSGGL